MENVFTWDNFVKVLIGLFIFYWLLKIITLVLLKLSGKIKTKRKVRRWSSDILLIFKPISVLLLLTVFIGINYVIHGILLLIVGIFCFQYIKSYLNGILFKTNPLIDRGRIIISGEYKGEILELMHLGTVLGVSNGKRFIDYSKIQQQGFSIIKEDEDSLLKTLYLSENVTETQVLDILFDNPQVNFLKPPTVKKSTTTGQHILKFTLERGGNLEDLVDFLVQNNIDLSSKNTAL